MNGINNFTAAEKNIHSMGKRIGFIVAFLIFGSILFLILSLTNKLPYYVKYWQLVTSIIVMSFILIKVKI